MFRYLISVCFAILTIACSHFETLETESGRKAILDDSKEKFFDKLQYLEIAAMTGEEVSTLPLDQLRTKTKKDFQDFVIDFTEKENSALKKMAKKVDELLSKDFPVLKDIPWKLLKVKSSCCSGFPHTRGPYTIMSEKILKRIPQTIDPDNANFKLLCSVLLHEKMHVAQRMYPEKFKKLYKELWNYSYLGQIKSPAELLPLQASNPDGLDLGYAVQVDHDLNSQTPALWLWPRTFFRSGLKKPRLGYDFFSVFLHIEKVNGEWSVAKKAPLPIVQKDYMQRFTEYGFRAGKDHPNELFAYTMEQVMGFGIEGLKQQEKAKVSTMHKICKKYFSK